MFDNKSKPFRLETFGKLFGIFREAYINDDMEQIKNAPKLMGAAARQTVEEAVFNLLASNPVLADSLPLIHADHGNSITGALTKTTLDQARAAMGKQVSNGTVLNIPPTHLLVPKSLEGQARQIAFEQYPTGGLEVVSSALLDLVSPTAWYLINKTRAPLVVATLINRSIPKVDIKEMFQTDAIEHRVLYDFAIVAKEFRSIVKSSGE